MFEKYIDWGQAAEGMLRNREDNLVALESLREQYEELLESDGVKSVINDGNRVQSNTHKDLVLNAFIQRETVKKRMEELSAEMKLYDKVWEQLSQEEKQVLTLFFESNMRRQDAIDLVCEEYSCERATAYRKKDAALRRFKSLLFG